jgi:hypothetical protein
MIENINAVELINEDREKIIISKYEPHGVLLHFADEEFWVDNVAKFIDGLEKFKDNDEK